MLCESAQPPVQDSERWAFSFLLCLLPCPECLKIPWPVAVFYIHALLLESFFLFFFWFLFSFIFSFSEFSFHFLLIRRELLYNVVLFSAYNNMNQLCVYIYPPPPKPPSPQPSRPSESSQSAAERPVTGQLPSSCLFYTR